MTTARRTGSLLAGLLLTLALPAAGTPASTPAAPPAVLATATVAPAPGSVADYYAGTSGLSGVRLKAKLHQIVSRQRVLSYGEVWTALQDTDQDPAHPSNVIELYTGWSVPKADHGGDPDDWNREHVWAKSHGGFGTDPGPGTDLHHLRPTDVTVNAARGNRDFDAGGTPNREAPANRSDGDSWEPRDAVKGDVARMILYMAVRYDGTDGWPDLEVNDVAGNGSAPRMGRLSVLRAWSRQDPPDAFERRRNERIHLTWQGNRNPFVDHPEWVASIF